MDVPASQGTRLILIWSVINKQEWLPITPRNFITERLPAVSDLTNAMTAAHKTLPFGTEVLVKNLNNGKEVTVRINDRGPFVKGRIIDLTRAAFSQIANLKKGVAKVEIRAVNKYKWD
jgi:3D (Asp-Asp-Asp) domain-containing protein